jgi:proton-dependent oligopeptide transporter, POT family
MAQNSDVTLPQTASDRSFFGHPRGLATLFFTEMWERFSYYGMRAILLLFMTSSAAAGGLGWDAAKAGPIYGLYTSMAYLACIPGGWLADRLLGQRRAVFWGGVIIMAGHICLALPGVTTFFLGLVLVVIGTGLLKPNISAMVGRLYATEDSRRDAGFSIFYMGINLGAFVAPLACGYLAQSEGFRAFLASNGLSPTGSWHWGFGAAAVGMALGLIQYAFGGRHLGTSGLLPERPADEAAWQVQRKGVLKTLGIGGGAFLLFAASIVSGLLPVTAEGLSKAAGWLLVIFPIIYFIYMFSRPGWEPFEKRRLVAVFILFLFAAMFWSAFEQAGSTFTLFAERLTRNTFLGFNFPSSWFQSVNSLFIWLLAPVFAWFWIRLGKREPSSPAKFAWGLLFVGLGFLVLVFGARLSGPEGLLVSPTWLISVYLLHSIGELCLSPVGLSTMTKLAPARVASQMLGVWFLGSSVGNYIGGRVSGLFETLPLPQLFGAVFGVCMLFTLAAVIAIRPLRRLMGGVH